MSEPGPGEPVRVSTPEELRSAIFERRAHIVVKAHLDLTTLPLITNAICPDGCSSPLPEMFDAESIRVLICLSFHENALPAASTLQFRGCSIFLLSVLPSAILCDCVHA